MHEKVCCHQIAASCPKVHHQRQPKQLTKGIRYNEGADIMSTSNEKTINLILWESG